MNTPVQYPFVRDIVTSRVIGTSVAVRGYEFYRCLGDCDTRMVFAKGTRNVPHFRHNGICADRDGALHHTAIETIRRGFESGKESGKGYHMAYPCECGQEIRFDAASAPAEILTDEPRVVPPYRADLAVTTATTVIIVEVVVTNPPVDDKITAYQASGHLVIMPRPNWHTVQDLKAELVVAASYVLNAELCGSCQGRHVVGGAPSAASAAQYIEDNSGRGLSGNGQISGSGDGGLQDQRGVRGPFDRRNGSAPPVECPRYGSDCPTLKKLAKKLPGPWPVRHVSWHPHVLG